MNEIKIASEFNMFSILMRDDVCAARCFYKKSYIELGCNMKKVNEYLLTESTYPIFTQFTNIGDYYEAYICPLLIHEVIHQVLYLIGTGITDSWDNIDNNHEISGFAIGGKR